MIPAQVRGEAASQLDAAAAKARQTMQDADALRRLTAPKPETPQPAQPPADGAYKKQDSGDLGRLILNNAK